MKNLFLCTTSVALLLSILVQHKANDQLMEARAQCAQLTQERDAALAKNEEYRRELIRIQAADMTYNNLIQLGFAIFGDNEHCSR